MNTVIKTMTIKNDDGDGVGDGCRVGLVVVIVNY